MNTHRVQGLALIVGAVCSLPAFLISDSMPFQYLSLLGTLLFIFGIPAVHVSQPSGTVGLIGIVLIILAAVIALGFGLGILGGTNFDGALVAISAFSGLAGRLIVGWLTITKHVFAQWIGWAFMAEGVTNFAGFLDLAALVSIISLLVILTATAAQLGYGFHIFRETKS
jgi:hypothetical protein